MVEHDKEPNPHVQEWSYEHDWVMQAVTTALQALTGLALIAWIVVATWVD
jgi:hypothetical protein